MKAVRFGIDLGTTNSLIARYDNGKVQVYKNPVGQKETLASVVAYRPERILIGDKAREYLTKDAVNVFGGFKRKMGTDEKYYVVNLDENVTPVELSTLVLQELKKFVPPTETPEAAVITIPASFDSMQSNATLKAGLEAGFREVFLLQEPIAACLAFFNQITESEKPTGNWLVYDLGGGTFDVALIKNSEEELKIVDHEGNNFLGGLDFDFAIIDQIILPAIVAQTGIPNFEEAFREKYGKYEKLYYEVMYYAEEAKKELSTAEATSIEFSAQLDGQSYDFYIPITREQLNELFLPLVNDTIRLLDKVLEQNRLTYADIQQIILVGGSTFLPQVREQLSAQTGIALNYSVDPTTSVAIGAAYYAANKYYQPETLANPKDNEMVEALLSSIAEPTSDVQIQINHPSSSRDKEEVLLLSASGEIDRKQYRIIRSDGGFDTGLMLLKPKKTEFLPLIPGMANHFELTVYDQHNNELTALRKAFSITQGMYNIDGQPLPNDICIEVDDLENKTTRLEAIFERNTLLPQKRTLYREISKTIAKGSKESIVIHILEGDKHSRPSSNLSIGYIEIAGKDLQSDLIKGSDIEIQIQLNESRVLSTAVYLVMTQQEFKNVFSISEKQINIGRLKEQYQQLELELRDSIQQFQYNENEIWEIKAAALLEELASAREKLFKLKEKDKSDEKYTIAEKISRISKEHDKLGGNERIATMIEQYFEGKERVREVVNRVDFEKEAFKKQFQQLEQTESSFIQSKNASMVDNKLKQLNDLYWRALSNTISFLIARFIEYKSYEPADFKDYNSAKSIMKMADSALQNEKYPDFKRHVFTISGMLKRVDHLQNPDFKGTGIG